VESKNNCIHNYVLEILEIFLDGWLSCIENPYPQEKLEHFPDKESWAGKIKQCTQVMTQWFNFPFGPSWGWLLAQS